MKERKYLKKCRYTSCSWVGSLNIVKMSVLPKFIYKFNIILIQIPEELFADLDKLTQKLIWDGKGTRITKKFCQKKKKVWGIILYHFKNYYRKLQKSRQRGVGDGTNNRTMSRIETPEIDLHKYGQLIFVKMIFDQKSTYTNMANWFLIFGSKAIQWKKGYLFNK